MIDKTMYVLAQGPGSHFTNTSEKNAEKGPEQKFEV